MKAWFGTIARLVVGGVWLAAGASKVGDLAASGRAVNAYELLPVEVGRVVGAALPLVELALGALLILGLATRLAAAVSVVLLAAFVAGIASVWARGLSIDCGCFGGGGRLAEGERPTYGVELLRDGGLLLFAGFLTWWPWTRLSLDARLTGGTDDEQQAEAEQAPAADQADPQDRRP